MPSFIPDAPTTPVVAVPFFEDQRSSKIPGRGTERSIERIKTSIMNLMMKLGAGAVHFTPGTYPGNPKRYGYQIHFSLNGIPGRLDCAALPLRTETAVKKDRALAQALYLVEHWLEAELHSHVYRPGSITLVPYLIGAGGLTVTEELIERRMLPDLLPAGQRFLTNGGA